MDSSNPAAEAYRRLYVAHTAVARAIERELIHTGVSLPQAIALQVIGTTDEPVTATQLASFMGQERQSMTGLIDRMEMKGWIARVRDLPDRRAIRLELTQPGRAKLDEIMPVSFSAVVQIFSRFSAHELSQLTATFESVYAAAAGRHAVPDEAPAAASV